MTQDLRLDDRPAAPAVEFVIVTGLSGAGRSVTARVLEDLGYFVIDNLRPSLIGRVAELAVTGR
ncbi:MAG TPA: RNase adapter RapZ, partial [Actinomycetota bacterium]|nr:RNase adapter RapZ [Actinomycetota bacterium]